MRGNRLKDSGGVKRPNPHATINPGSLPSLGNMSGIGGGQNATATLGYPFRPREANLSGLRQAFTRGPRLEPFAHDIVDAGLPTGTRGLQSGQHVGVETDRGRTLLRGFLRAAPSALAKESVNTTAVAHHVIGPGLGFLCRGRTILAWGFGYQPVPVARVNGKSLGHSA